MFFKMFLANRTNRVFSLLMAGCLVFAFGVLCYEMFFFEKEYTSIKQSVIVEPKDLSEKIVKENPYVVLQDFCVDSNQMEFTQGERTKVIYAFLNDFCEEKSDYPLVIVEYKEEFFNECFDSNSESGMECFSGRLYKGYKSEEIPFISLQKYVKSRNIYTLKAGVTPQFVFESAMMRGYIIGGFAVGLFFIFFLVVILNRKNKV